jgi:hypothetical protein
LGRQLFFSAASLLGLTPQSEALRSRRFAFFSFGASIAFYSRLVSLDQSYHHHGYQLFCLRAPKHKRIGQHCGVQSYGNKQE